MMLAYALASALLAQAAPLTAIDDDVATKEKIFDAWRKREKDLLTYSCKLELVTDELVSAMHPTSREAIEANSPQTGEYKRIVKNYAINIDGDSFDAIQNTRDAEKLGRLSGGRRGFNGDVSYRYSGTPVTPGARGTGVVSAEKHEHGTNIIQLKPIVLFLRPLHQTMGKIDASYRCAPGSVGLGDHSCVILEQIADLPERWKFWIDVENGSLIRRIELHMQNERLFEIDIDYKQKHEGYLCPERWEGKYHAGNGIVQIANECTIIEQQINGVIPKETFAVTFPVGTVVRDSTNKTQYVAGEADANQRKATLGMSTWPLLGVNSVVLVAASLFFLYRQMGKGIVS